MKKNLKYIILSLILILLTYLYNIYTEDVEDIQGINTQEENKYKVVNVIDGDTVELEKIGKVRLIGVDTPETVNLRKKVECFGKEASEYTSQKLLNKYVTIEYDNTQDKEDKYGRDLVYILINNNNNFNLELIKNGYAHEYTYQKPYKYQKLFKQAQEYAKDNNLGLWGAICN